MKKILPWLFSGFMFCVALIYMPSLASIFALITAVAILPIPPIQNLWAGLTNKKTGKSLSFLKPIVVTLSFVLAIMCTPETESAEPVTDAISKQNSVVAEISTKQVETPSPKDEALARLEEKKKAQEQVAKEEAERKAAEEAAAKQAAEQKAAEEAKLEAEKKAAEEAAKTEATDKSTSNADTEQPSSSITAPITSTYILNTNKKVFHKSDCPSVSQMSEKNKAACDDRDYAISHGYNPCGRCNP